MPARQQSSASPERSLEVRTELHVPRGTIAVQTELIRREGSQLPRGPVAEERQLDLTRELIGATLGVKDSGR